MAREELLNLRKPAMEALDELKGEFKNSFVWDPFPLLCPDASCAPYMKGRPLYFDGDHLSSYGNYILVDSFSEKIAGMVGGAGVDNKNAGQ